MSAPPNCNSLLDKQCDSDVALSDLAQITVPLHRIIPFSNVEGAGNRTSIFLQGCKLNCLYCHNPETIPRYVPDSKLVSLQYLFEQVQNAIPFIRGVTFSGGEPTIHHRQLIPLFKKIRAIGLTCYLDSCGYFEFHAIRDLIAETDKFLFDLKGVGIGLESLCFDRKNKEGIAPDNPLPTTARMKTQNLNRNRENLKQLLPLGKIEEVRLVWAKDFFNAYDLVEDTAQLLKPYPEVMFKLIRMHAKGTRDPEGMARFIPTETEIDQLADFAKQAGIKHVVKIY